MTVLTRILAICLLMTGMALSARAETLRIVPHAHLYSIDPVFTMEYITRAHGYLVYDTLFAQDENGRAQPQMVQDWTVSEDGLEWRFTLRQGQTWHDGTQVTADDCVASLLRWGTRDASGWRLLSNTESIAPIDTDSFTIRLRSPHPGLIDDLAKSTLNVPFMMPRRIAQTSPYVPISDATGSGPYRFLPYMWLPGKMAAYERNTNYMPRAEPSSFAAGAKTAHFDRIELLGFSEPRAALQALVDGEVQFIETPSMLDLGLISGRTDIGTAVLDPGGNTALGIFNHQMPPFDNPGIRRAALMAMEQTMYLGAAISDKAYWSPCLSIYPCHTRHASPIDTGLYMRGDIDLARKALLEAGYDGSPVVILDPVDSALISSFAKVSVALLRQIGMTVVHQETTWNQLRDAVGIRTGAQGQVWNMFHTWWTADDLADPLHILFSGDPVRGWVGWPSDPELEALRTRFALSRDEAEQADLARQIQDRIVRGGNLAVLGQFIQPVALRRSLDGIEGPFPLYYNIRTLKD